jgi:glutathione-regulated potassium-efflux system protein KefB
MGHGTLELILVFLLAAVIAIPLFGRLGLGVVLGYLAAGVAIGPHGLKLATDPVATLAISELGVAMLLFVIGLELSPARLWVMRRAVFGLGALQALGSALALGLGLYFLGLGWKAALVIGLALALSSTAVGLQLLAERKELASDHGRQAFAILLFQDILAIPLLAAIPLLGDAGAGNFEPVALLKAVGMIALVIVGGRFALRYGLRAVARARSVEAFSATALLVVIGTAWLMHQVGLSMGLGAFLAGMLLADSEYRHELEAHVEPFKGLLLGLFFIAVGMGLDLRVVAEEPWLVLGGTCALLGVKSAILFGLGLRPGGLDWRDALRLGTLLALGGEFAFVVFGEAFKAELIDAGLRNRLTVIVGLSLALTPLSVIVIWRWLAALPGREPRRAFDAIDHDNPRVIIAGFGRMGQIVGRLLAAQKIPFTALEQSPEQVDLSRRFGNKIYFGDPARPEVLRAARADRAEIFVAATDDPEANLRTVRLVRRHYPHLKVFARARNRQHVFRLMDLGVQSVTRETLHSSLAMATEVLVALGLGEEQARARVRRFQEHDERILHEQYLVYDDEAALVASAQEALRELERLFAADDAEADAGGEAQAGRGE